MPAYDVTIWKDFTHYATATFIADTPTAAIESARQSAEDGDVDWEACDDGGNPVHFIRAEPNQDAPDNPSVDDAEHCDEWDADKAEKNAARAMLAALHSALCYVGDDHTDDSAEARATRQDITSAIAQAHAAGIFANGPRADNPMADADERRAFADKDADHSDAQS